MNYNIETNKVELETLIEMIRKDNMKIESSVKKMNEIVSQLDRKIWNSPEKQKIEEEFFPYLKANEKYIPQMIEDCIIVLDNANKKYSEKESMIETEANKLTDYE